MNRTIEELELRAAERLRAENEALAGLPERPRPGDLYTLAEGEDAGLEWAVLDFGGANGTTCLLVAADSAPYQGDADVVVAAGEAAGPLRLRCRQAVRVEAASLPAERRSGVLSAHAVAEARERVAASGERTAIGDADSEYRAWEREHLAPAAEALAAARPARQTPARAPAAPSPRRSAPKPRWAALAAALLLGAGLSWAIQSLMPPSGPAPTGEGLDPVVNPRLVWLMPRPEAERGSQDELALPVGSESRVTFVLETWSATPFDRYRVELEAESGGPLWVSDELERQGTSEIHFALPPSLLPEGQLTFRLFGLPRSGPTGAPAATEPVALETYRLRVTRSE